MTLRKGAADPEQLVRDYSGLLKARTDAERRLNTNKVEEDGKGGPPNPRPKPISRQEARARRASGKLCTRLIRIPEEIADEIDVFCQRFNLSRPAWFGWAVVSQYLVYKKMMNDAEGTKPESKADGE